ncbi:MAG: arsenic resistance N-acetyltransferase ArsN2 [Leptolyngbyaceae cyanobacterium MO_188.B28]|nr:arsenic resistance N-acetyltransferase ArsN2 [Leptolyngbyaceae cyanobacterium MO_188.B28]
MTTKQITEPRLQPATPNDLPLILRWLQENHLPSSDIPTRLNAIFLYRIGAEVVGLGGIEQFDAYGLLRSVVVAPPFRGKGLGKRLCRALLHQADQQGIRELYLLTETAERLFEKLGFQTIERRTAPPEIQKTTEFSQLCPAVATCMKRVYPHEKPLPEIPEDLASDFTGP